MADTEDTKQELRSQMHLHTGFVTWYKTEHGIDLEKLPAAEVIARFAAKRNEYRRSDFYTTLKANHAASIEREQAERAEAKAKEKAEKKAAAEKAKAEKAETAKAAAAKKAPAKKAAAKKAPAKKAAAKKVSGSEDPFS